MELAGPRFCCQTVERQHLALRPCYILYWGARDEDVDRDTARRINFMTELGDDFYARDPVAQCSFCKLCRPAWIKTIKCWDAGCVKLNLLNNAGHVEDGLPNDPLSGDLPVPRMTLPSETLFRNVDSSLVDKVFVEKVDFVPLILELPQTVIVTITWSRHTECVLQTPLCPPPPTRAPQLTPPFLTFCTQPPSQALPHDGMRAS